MSDQCEQLKLDYELLTHEIFRHTPHTGISFSAVPGLRFIRREDPARQENILFTPPLRWRWIAAVSMLSIWPDALRHL